MITEEFVNNMEYSFESKKDFLKSHHWKCDAVGLHPVPSEAHQ